MDAAVIENNNIVTIRIISTRQNTDTVTMKYSRSILREENILGNYLHNPITLFNFRNNSNENVIRINGTKGVSIRLHRNSAATLAA